jgi:hypothetical protein
LPQFYWKCNGKNLLNYKKKGAMGQMKNIIRFGNKKGMELVQVGILIGIAVVIGLIFKSEITSFVNQTFDTLFESF